MTLPQRESRYFGDDAASLDRRVLPSAHLSVKTLRHYHEVGLLEPSEIDPNSGYRYYSYEQIPTAQVIRRLRGLEMPVAEVKAVLAAPDARRGTG